MPTTSKDIEDIILKENDDKALGADGFNAIFFKNKWNIIKDNVVKYVKSFFSTDKLLREVNKTHVILILKNLEAKTVFVYIPISLCNFIYNVITKLMANRLQPILSSVISCNQSSFVKHRSIIYALLLENQMMHDFDK